MSTEPLIAGNTTSTGSSQTADTTVETTATAAATTTETTATEQNTPVVESTQQAETSVEKQTEKHAEGTEPKEAPKPKAPDKYEFKAPDGSEFKPEVMKEFEGVAKALDLSQDDAQKVVDAMAPKIRDAQLAHFEATKTEWTNSAKADKEFGGAKLGENLAVAEKALTAFGSPELRQLLVDTGLGNHPEIIRAFFRAGQKISSGNLVIGGEPPGEKDAAATLYPNQSKG